MITLAPISKNIQNTLKQKIAMLMAGAGKTVYSDGDEWKINPIGTTVSTDGEITQNYMFARTPWLRMVSFTPKENFEAVIIQGGEMNDDGSLKSGFESGITKPNSTVSEDGKTNFKGLYNPNGKIPYRPLAGIKDIDVGYKGGGMKLGATREAKITWSCWSFEDLERLQRHFLKEGKSVLLEWGWTGLGILKEDPLLNIFKYTDDGKIRFKEKLGLEESQDLNQKILQHIQNQKGHYDALFGLVTNYTWSIRDDGGFDCQTSLIAPGVTMLQKTVQKTSRAKTFSRLPMLPGIKTDAGEEPEKYEIDSETGAEVDPQTETTEWKSWNKKKDSISEGNLQAIKDQGMVELAPYVTFREYMSDFPEQIKSNYRSFKKYSCFESETIAFPKPRIERDSESGDKPPVDVEEVSFGKKSDGSSLWVTWGWFEDNVLSRFFGSIAKDSKVIGEFRSIEQSVDREGNYRYVGDSKTVPIMQATRFKNSRYILTTNASKWIIIKDTDPVFTETKWTQYDSSGILSKFWREDTKIEPEEINKNTKEHLVIRNVLFNVKFLSDRLKDEMDLLSGVNGIWNAVASEYGGVFRFKVDYDDTGHRLFLKEQSYSEFKVEDYITTMKNKESDQAETGKPSLFVFPTFEAGSIVKSNNLSAKLPNRMKIAAMYGANKPKSRSKKDLEMSTDGHDDLISRAWGRLGEGKSMRDLEEGKDGATLRDIRKSNKKDLMTGDMDFPSRDNRNFGREDADTQKPLLVGGTSDGTKIHTSIYDEMLESAKEELLRRKRAAERDTAQNQGEATTGEVNAAQEEAERLQNNFETFTGGSTVGSDAGTILPIAGLDFYEWIETDDKEGLTDAEKKAEQTSTISVGYPRVKYEILNKIDKSLRTARDGIFKKISPIIPVDFNMDIDGTGGLYPGNSFHSSYIPDVYKERCLFQITGVDHRVSGGEWTTQIKGQIRAKPMDSGK
jgi:hypothetical protein